MRIIDLLEKNIAKPKKSQCDKPKADLSAVRYSQCVSLGYKAHDSDHTAGTGQQGKKGSGVKLKGKRMASVKHGGSVKNYGGSHS
jgi:hypothetical protein